jgi:hypothetical protein
VAQKLIALALCDRSGKAMMMTKVDQGAETASLLESFGMELSAGGLLVMTDFAKAESAYIHHSTVPVAVVAMAIVSPTFARGRFPKLRLVDAVAKAPSMDGREMRALAAVCGANIDSLPEGSSRAPAFAAHLLAVIARYELNPLFTRVPDRAVNGIDAPARDRLAHRASGRRRDARVAATL